MKKPELLKNCYGKIGIALITYNRPKYFSKVFSNLQQHNWGGADVKVIVEDWSGNKGYDALAPFRDPSKHPDITLIRNEKNLTVGLTKNVALKYLYEQGCKHIFLIEDDILMKTKDVCIQYVKEAKRIQIHHLNFALHGPLNKANRLTRQGGALFTFWNGVRVKIYPHCVGAFSYYSRELIEKVGYIDEFFNENCWEHVEYTYRICNSEMSTLFWNFVDHINNHDLLEEIPESINESSIKSDRNKIYDAKWVNYWTQKHGSWLFAGRGQ